MIGSGDYISREAVVSSLNRLCDRVCVYSKAQRKVMCGACPLGDAFTVIEDDIPAADVRPVKRGKWIMNDECRTVCSLCGNVVAFVSHPDRRWDFGNYCPNCGADMRGESDA